jgi:hypothetical protein
MNTGAMPRGPAIVYCHCKYAQVLPVATKEAVLRALCDSGLPFEAVPDLCEASARRDDALKRLASAGPIKIAACYPRAVKWLFAAAGAPLDPATTEVVNLRTLAAQPAAESLLSAGLEANLPAGKVTATDAPTAQPGPAPTES